MLLDNISVSNDDFCGNEYSKKPDYSIFSSIEKSHEEKELIFPKKITLFTNEFVINDNIIIRNRRLSLEVQDGSKKSIPCKFLF